MLITLLCISVAYADPFEQDDIECKLIDSTINDYSCYDRYMASMTLSDSSTVSDEYDINMELMIYNFESKKWTLTNVFKELIVDAVWESLIKNNSNPWSDPYDLYNDNSNSDNYFMDMDQE